VRGEEQSEQSQVWGQSNPGNFCCSFRWVWGTTAAGNRAGWFWVGRDVVFFWVLNTDTVCLCPTAIIPDINRL